MHQRLWLACCEYMDDIQNLSDSEEDLKGMLAGECCMAKS